MAAASQAPHRTRRAVRETGANPTVYCMAPVPLYNSFEDVFRFGEALNAALK